MRAREHLEVRYQQTLAKRGLLRRCKQMGVCVILLSLTEAP